MAEETSGIHDGYMWFKLDPTLSEEGSPASYAQRPSSDLSDLTKIVIRDSNPPSSLGDVLITYQIYRPPELILKTSLLKMSLPLPCPPPLPPQVAY